MKAKNLIKDADFLLIAGGAGLSASADLDYTSEIVFKKHFPVMHEKGFRRMYEFIGYKDWTPDLQWGYLFSQVNLARFNWGKSQVYQILLDKLNQLPLENSFVLTSNADGMFEQNGFPVDRIYTAQGDYSRIQCLKPCSQTSYWPIKPMIEAALAHIDPKTQLLTKQECIPKCPNCGSPMMMNVRGGDWFLETPHLEQKKKFTEWKRKVLEETVQGKKLVILEIGAGFNTPSVLRWPMEALAENEGVSLIRINFDHEQIPFSLNSGFCFRGDALSILSDLL